MESVLQQPQTTSSRATPAAVHWSGAALIATWLLPGLFTLGAMDVRELFEGSLWLAGLLVVALLFRGRAAERALGRLWLAVLFLFTALLLSAPFHRSIAAGTFDSSDALVKASVAVSSISALLFCAWARWARSAMPLVAPPVNTLERLEALLASFGTRLHLAAALILAAIAGAALAGVSMKSLPLRIVVLGAYTFGLQPVLAFARIPGGARTLQIACGSVLAISVGAGALRYLELNNVIAEGAALLDQDKPEDAAKVLDRARALNKTLYSQSLEIEIERKWALYYERRDNPTAALKCWEQIADIQRIDRSRFAPILRMQTRIGDSITVWRRAVYEGLDSIDAEVAPGIVGLAANSNDVRAKVLSALLAWHQNLSEAERRKRLDEVQLVAAGEPTSYNLLNRMGANLPPATLWLPDSLLVGRKASLYSALGSIGELGEIETMVLLDKGQWEIAIEAAGVPLNEIWPIIRVELNGHEIGRSQVTRSEKHEVPFVVDINRGNLYRLKIVFQNKESDFDLGRKAMRGLSIQGIVFRRAAAQ